MVEIQVQLKVIDDWLMFSCVRMFLTDDLLILRQELYAHMDNDQYHNNYILARNLMCQ